MHIESLACNLHQKNVNDSITSFIQDAFISKQINLSQFYLVIRSLLVTIYYRLLTTDYL